jgi:hypothetical protein
VVGVFLGDTELAAKAMDAKVAGLDPTTDGLSRHADLTGEIAHGEKEGQSRG